MVEYFLRKFRVGRSARSEESCNNDDIDRCCPICLCKLPLNPLARKTLECCGNTFCRRCLMGGWHQGQGMMMTNSNSSINPISAARIIDSCPLCRSHITKKTLQGQLTQARRLVDAKNDAASLDHGIAVLEQIINEASNLWALGGSGNSNVSGNDSGSTERAASSTNIMQSLTSTSIVQPNTTPSSSTTAFHQKRRREIQEALPDVQLTLARALCKKETCQSLDQALLVLQSVLATMDEEPKKRNTSSKTTSLKASSSSSSSPAIKPASVASIAIKVSGLKPPAKSDSIVYHLSGSGTAAGHKQSKFLAQAHFLRGEIYRKQGQQQQQQQACYELAVQYDPHNIALLLACAKRMSNNEYSRERQLQLYRQIVDVNKYHVAANLWLAKYYRQRALDVVMDDHNQSSRNVTSNVNGLSTSSSLAPSSMSSQRQHRQSQELLFSYLTSCYACILRAEFRAVSMDDKQACTDLKIDLQTNFGTFYSNSKTKQMDRISAAFVPY